MPELPFISVIIPVRNDASLLRRCLLSISKADYPDDKLQVIVSDGMSSDNSASIARELGAEVIENRKQTVSPGRNAAFPAARGSLVAFTDADCVVDRNWLRNALPYFEDPAVACVGGPNLTPPDETAFGRAVGFVFDQPLFAAGSIHARILDGVQEAESIPGCNAVYRKEALARAMPVDESLITCDDTMLNRKLLDLGYRLLYTPDVFVQHYRRPTPMRLARQFYRYAIGRLQAGKRDHRMLNRAHVLTGLGLPLLALLGLLSLRALSAAVIAGAAVLLYFTLKGFRVLPPKTALLIPFVASIIFASWSMGFMRELLLPVRGAEGNAPQ